MDVENGQEGGVSERKREANRKNAKKSTGPRSHAGKERSKGNATTHALSAQALLITVGELKEDPEAWGQLLTGLIEYYKPVGMPENIVVEKIAGCRWRDLRAQRYEAGAIQRQVEFQRHMETARSHDRLKDARMFGEDLEPIAEGIRHLLDGLNTAVEEIQGKGWSEDSYNFVKEYFGHRISLPPSPVMRAGGQGKVIVPDDLDPQQLLKELKAQGDRLRERLPEVEAAEKHEGDARVRSYTLPNAKDLDLLLRYATPNGKELHKAMDQLRRLQADRRRAEAAAGAAEGDQPSAT
jgi:hypothetical protein